MRIVVFGATGMIGQGVLRECLVDPGVDRVLAVGRTPTGREHPKLVEAAHRDFADLSALGERFEGVDACFYCLGVSSAGRSEAEYRRVTLDYPLAAARTLAERSPGAAFVYVSGAGADPTERGRVMWARVKGAAENALFASPLRAHAFRPGYVRPLHGAVSRTPLYRAAYAVLGPVHPLLAALAPNRVTTTEAVGRAMLAVARGGWPDPVLDTRAINAAAARG